jgi:hypothetical protein
MAGFGASGQLWCLLQNDVSVGAAKPERTDSCAPRNSPGRPGYRIVSDGQAGAFQGDERIKPLEMEMGRYHLVLHGQDDFDQTGHARGPLQVAPSWF